MFKIENVANFTTSLENNVLTIRYENIPIQRPLITIHSNDSFDSGVSDIDSDIDSFDSDSDIEEIPTIDNIKSPKIVIKDLKTYKLSYPKEFNVKMIKKIQWASCSLIIDGKTKVIKDKCHSTVKGVLIDIVGKIYKTMTRQQVKLHSRIYGNENSNKEMLCGPLILRFTSNNDIVREIIHLTKKFRISITISLFHKDRRLDYCMQY